MKMKNSGSRFWPLQIKIKIQGVSKFANSKFRAWQGRTQWGSKNTLKKNSLFLKKI
jgi:hypothetical protein